VEGHGWFFRKAAFCFGSRFEFDAEWLDDLWVVVEWDGVAECVAPVECVTPDDEWLLVEWLEPLDGVCVLVE